MTLVETAYLEIEGDSATATFELEASLQYQSSLSKSYLMGERGQYLREIVNQTPGTGSFDVDRRTGFWIDGGAGEWEIVVDVGAGLQDIRWGDGSGGDGPSNVTQTDASGPSVLPISRLQVFQYWIAKSKSDSGGDTRLHYGEWTDGDLQNVSGVSAGAFGEPMPVAITSNQLSVPDPDQGSQGNISGQVTMSHVALFGGYGAPGWAEDAIGAAIEAADIIPDR